MNLNRLLLPVVSLMLGVPAPARAQAGPDAIDLARFHVGPLALTPRIAIQNLGIDTNVFNAAETPLRDGTAVVRPGVDAWLRAGRVLLSSKTTVDVVYYRTATSERSLNLDQSARLDVDLLHVVPRLTGRYLRTRQRPNEEIDDRVQQTQVSGGIGFTMPIGARVHLDADVARMTYDFSDGTYGDPEIARALNRDSQELSLRGRVDVTPLTSVAVRADALQDRFEFTPDRDSDSLRVMPGLVFHPSAVIAGSAFVGVRRLTTLSTAVPDYSGVVAAVELRYSALDMFRVTGEIKRDVDYSLDLNEPFFVSTSAGVEVMQAIGLNWDVRGRVRRGRLTYPEMPGLPGRTDRVGTVGVGAGRRIGDEWRIGFDVDYVTRTSAVPSRTFDGLRIGGSLTYGY